MKIGRIVPYVIIYGVFAMLWGAYYKYMGVATEDVLISLLIGGIGATLLLGVFKLAMWAGGKFEQ